MGRGAKLKKIRKIASQLPVINKMQPIGEVVTGKELMEQGITEVEGKPVGDKNYRQITKKKVPINHYGRMKKMYDQHGAAGVNMYTKAVKEFTESQKAKPKEDEG